jgi:SAM-dependent methyltransferase
LERLNLPNLEVRRHNILEDSIEDLGLGSFDMVSLRLVLFWLVGRQEEVIGRIVQCLRPGGWLVDEDGDWGTVVPVNPFHPMYERYQQVWKNGDWWTARGYDPEFGRKLPVLIEHCGLQRIGHEAHAEVLRGTSPWGRWWLQTLEVMRASDEAAGVLTEAREGEYGILTAPWSDPFVLVSNCGGTCLLGAAPSIAGDSANPVSPTPTGFAEIVGDDFPNISFRTFADP